MSLVHIALSVTEPIAISVTADHRTISKLVFASFQSQLPVASRLPVCHTYKMPQCCSRKIQKRCWVRASSDCELHKLQATTKTTTTAGTMGMTTVTNSRARRGMRNRNAARDKRLEATSTTLRQATNFGCATKLHAHRQQAGCNDGCFHCCCCSHKNKCLQH